MHSRKNGNCRNTPFIEVFNLVFHQGDEWRDDKTDTLKRVHSFAFKQHDAADKVRDLFILAESYLEKEEFAKCLDIYQKIQSIAPGELESGENINIIKGTITAEHILEYLRKGEKIIASLLLGHYLEKRLKIFTRKLIGRSFPGLYDCLKELEHSKRLSGFKKELFHKVLNIRNKSIHSPYAISEEDFEKVLQNLRMLEAKY